MSILIYHHTFIRIPLWNCVCSRHTLPATAISRLHSRMLHERSIRPQTPTTTSTTIADRSTLRNEGSNSSTDDHTETTGRVRRIPNYSGWWTEVMKVRLEPPRMPDPSLNLSKGHVFQGRAAAPNSISTTTSSPVINNQAKDEYNPLNPLGTKKTDSSNEAPTLSSSGSSVATSTSSLSPAAEYYEYQGYKIPIKPNPPGAEDCCMSGCAVCVYDIYEEDRQAYKEKLAEVLKKLEAAGIPPPPGLIRKQAQNVSPSAAREDKDDDIDLSMKAFLELERKLKGG